jgi:hypothetical protein
LNLKKTSVRLRLLSSDISDYFRGSYFGVPAMDTDVLRLWTEYNAILGELKEYDPQVFSDYEEIPYPAPYLADADCFYKEGTMIYKPEHFAPLRTAVEALLKVAVPLTWSKESA